MKTYASDKQFLEEHGQQVIELVAGNGRARLLVLPQLQGRVMTSTATGMEGNGFGWINYDYMEQHRTSTQFNPFGGEERFWLGPEGGPFSLYFVPGTEQVYANWKVPAVLDTQAYEVVACDSSQVLMTAKAELQNANGFDLKMRLTRRVSLVDSDNLGQVLPGLAVPQGVAAVAYRSVNTVQNLNEVPWTKETGMVNVWMLGQFNPSPTTTVFIPYKEEVAGQPVKDDYFGTLPEGRLVLQGGVAYFKIDGELRAKIGMSPKHSKGWCGSYDAAQKVLTLLVCDAPKPGDVYLNGQWGAQDDPFAGDALNAYNDGPLEDGSIMGPFYEIETCSAAAALDAGGELSHAQTVIHLQGDERQLDGLLRQLLGVGLDTVKGVFAK